MTATAIKERPILFSAEMVRALLDGRKAQTRRVVKPQPHPDTDEVISEADGFVSCGHVDAWWDRIERGDLSTAEVAALEATEEYDDADRKLFRYDGFSDDPYVLCELAEPICCPYGKPGDRLWVRETWMPLWETGDGNLTCLPATEKPDVIKYLADGEKPDGFDAKWRPSIHMPRRASRITLEITGVRVERSEETREWEWVIDFRVIKG